MSKFKVTYPNGATPIDHDELKDLIPYKGATISKIVVDRFWKNSIKSSLSPVLRVVASGHPFFASRRPNEHITHGIGQSQRLS